MAISYGTIEKSKSHAFKKDVFLLGEDKDGIRYWLEAPSWDCGHYWGFVYIETYTNNNSPSTSRDVNSHQHAGNFMEWCIKWNGKEPILSKTTFTDKEAWQLCELFRRFELFKELAGFYHRGSCYVSEVPLSYGKDEAKEQEINQVVIREIMDKIIEIVRGY